ncbi:MAG: PAS domain S-box protein [Smithella sp.]
MKDLSKTKHELIKENSLLRQRIQELEISEAERERTEKELHESEKRYRLLFENAIEGIFQTTLDGRFIMINFAMARMIGYNSIQDAIEKITDTGSQLYVNPDERKALIDRLIQVGQVKGSEVLFKRADGSTIKVMLNYNLVHDKNGTPVFIEGSCIDITGKWLAEEALKASEEKYRKIFEGATEGIFQTTPEGRYLSMNPAFARMFGFASPQEMIDFATNIGQQFYVKPKDREKMVRLLNKYNKIDGYEVELYRKDRSRFWVSINIHTVRDDSGDILYFEGTNQYIDKRKRMEKLLRASEERFRSLVETTSDWIWEMDAEGAYTYSSPKVKDILGYESSEILGRTPVDLMPSAEAERASKEMFQHFKEKKPFVAFENINLHKDGQMVVLETSGVPILDENGQMTGYRGIDRDITERKRAEDALRESEAILRGVFKATPVGLCIMKDRVFQSVNSAYLENLGYDESDIIGYTPRLLYKNEEEYNRVGRELFASLTERGLTSVQTKHLRKDGSLRDVALTAVPLPSKDISSGMVVVTVLDITDRKRAEEELKENRRQLANIIEFLPDATCVIDKDGKVIAWNRAMEAMTGVKKESMIGKSNYEYALPFYGERRQTLIDLALYPDSETEKKYTAIQRVGDTLIGETFTPHLLDGNVHVSVTASVLRDEKGEITAAIECIRNNTERKKLEERLNRAEKMESLGTLAGGVAHDLNNVLGGVVGYSELLRDEIPENSFLRRYADNIMQSGIRGAAIIQDLLTLARRGVTVSEVVDLNKIVFDYLRTPEFEKLKSYHPEVKIEADLEDKLLNIKGSPVHLGKTIMNLISNAFEASSDHGEVMIRTANRYLDQPVRGYDTIQEGDYALLMVSDNGIGISDNDLNKIFEPFYTKKVMGRSGTGLGLAVVWGTVNDHNGYIDVQSKEGKGTAFTLYFPVTREKMGEVDKSVSPVVYMGKGEFILVVDDVEEQREVAVSMLVRLGYQVETVAGGEEAIEFLKNKKADLIVLDMIMDPGIDGMETYRRVLEINPVQKVVIVSGFSETDRVRNAQEMGAGAFVPKPYILENIGLAVRNELDRKLP